MTRIRYAFALAIAVSATAACGVPEVGTPLPGSMQPSEPSGGGQMSSAPPSAGGSGAGETVDPCSFLPPDQASQLGVRPGVQALETDQSTGCDYDGSPGFRVIYYYNRPYQERVANAQSVTINDGSHRAVVGGSQADVGCSVSMELTADTSAEVLAADTELSEEKNCQVAKLAAQAVEPNLPQG